MTGRSFLAVSVIPLMIASGLEVIRSGRLTLLPVLALIASTVVFFGSHLLTAIRGTTILVIAGLMPIACVPAARRFVRPRNALRLACVMVPAVLVSAWFLLPTAAYQANTVVARSYLNFVRLMKQDMYLVSVPNLFTLSHNRVPGTITTTALPVLAMAWVLAGIAIAVRARSGGTWMRVVLLLCAGDHGAAGDDDPRRADPCVLTSTRSCSSASGLRAMRCWGSPGRCSRCSS